MILLNSVIVHNMTRSKIEHNNHGNLGISLNKERMIGFNKKNKTFINIVLNFHSNFTKFKMNR